MRKLIAGLLFLLSACGADAATLISTASGNINATGTWSVIDTTGTNAYLNSETANTALTTSPVASSAFTPAAETLTAIAVKIASVAAAPSGTMTVKLANSTSPGSRECTITVNVADLPTASAATAEGGFVFLACAASPNGTDSYTINANTSVAAQVNLFSLATTNWSRALVTNGTQANGPAAGDKFFVNGVLTGAGTHSAFTVTVNTTANINYGNVANTLVDPSIDIGQWGTLAFGTTTATNFKMEFAGPAVIYNGGTFSIGTSGTTIPSTSTATLTLNSSSEGDTGINVRNGGTFNSAGNAGGRTVVKTKLTAQATANVTATLTTADSTGWLSGDSIFLAGTSTTAATTVSYQGEALTAGNASGTSLPFTGGGGTGGAVANTHTAQQLSYTSSSGTGTKLMNMYADVVLLNHNVVIQGSGATTNGYLYFQQSSNAAMDQTEFSQISGINVRQRGIEADTGPSGTFTLTNFSIINSHNSTLVLAPTNTNFGGPNASSYVTVQHGVIYNSGTASQSGGTNQLAVLAAVVNPYWKIDDIALILCGNGGPNNNSRAVVLDSVVGQFSNISITGSGMGPNGIPVFAINTAYGTAMQIGGGVGNTFGPLTLYSNVGYLIAGGNGGAGGATGTINGLYIWHEQGRASFGAMTDALVIDPFYMIDSTFGIYVPPHGADITVRNGVIGWDGSASTVTSILTLDADAGTYRFDNMDICPANGPLGGVTFVSCTSPPISLLSDLAVGAGSYNAVHQEVYLRNSAILSGSPYPTANGQESYYGRYSFISQDCAGCSPIKHGAVLQGGFVSYDTVITHVSGYSERLTPRVTTFSGYIAGTTLTVTSGAFTTAIGSSLTSNGGGFIPGTTISSFLIPNYAVTLSQTVGSAGSPVQFQDYINYGSLIRLASAPPGKGSMVAVKSGVSNAQYCTWLRPSLNTDAAPPWGGSAVTYNGDPPRMIVRANPAMGILDDTVIATSSPTAGTWGQFCGTLPIAPNDGMFEVVIDADQTFTSNAGGWVNVAEPSCTNCTLANNTEFWFNGVPFDTNVPAGGGGGGGNNSNHLYIIP